MHHLCLLFTPCCLLCQFWLRGNVSKAKPSRLRKRLVSVRRWAQAHLSPLLWTFVLILLGGSLLPLINRVTTLWDDFLQPLSYLEPVCILAALLALGVPWYYVVKIKLRRIEKVGWSTGNGRSGKLLDNISNVFWRFLVMRSYKD